MNCGRAVHQKSIKLTHSLCSPVEFENLLEKITIIHINSLSYTEFSEEYENDPCQVVSFGEKKL